MWHSEFKLHLYPTEPTYQANLKKLHTHLQSLEFTGKLLSSTRYSTGKNFVSLLTFMGCSPNVELEPQDDKPYCYVEISSLKSPQLITGKNTKFPPCPHCKNTLKNISCDTCNKQIDLTKLNWRKSAFIASSWITIGNIYELEAIPSDQLLDALENKTGVIWKPAYIREEIIQ